MTVRTVVNPCVIVGTLESERPPKPPNNVFYFSLETNQLSFYNGVEWSERDSTAIKLTSQTVVSTGTLFDDPYLSILVVRNAQFAVSGYLKYTTTDAADIRFAWTVPTGSTLDWTTNALGVNSIFAGGNDGDGEINKRANTAGESLQAGGLSGVPVTAGISGILSTSTLPGFFRLRWAQGVSTAVSTTLHAKSWISLKRIA